MITVEHLTKRYGNHVAVDDLSFTVEPGEVCGLLGPNSAGKSTTMNILTGYLSATSGKVLIDGCDIFEAPEQAKRKIGYLPEIPPVYGDMTPMEYLRFVTALHKIPKNRHAELIAAAVEKTDISSAANRLIRNLSKGYRQRIGLAAVLACDPSVIILDEPTVGLDPKQIIEIRELIRSLGQTHTVLLSSHILSEVSAVCGKVLILSHGKLIAYDTPENLEKRAQGSGVLSVTVAGTQDRVRSALAPLFGESALSFADGADGSVQVRVACPPDSDRRADVSLELAKHGLAVTEMRLETLSLEDVFLELTNPDGESVPAKASENVEFPRQIALDANGRVVLRIDESDESVPEEAAEFSEPADQDADDPKSLSSSAEIGGDARNVHDDPHPEKEES